MSDLKSGLNKKVENLEKALASLERAVATPPVEERDFAGIIQSFEFVYEMTWKTLKAILMSNGIDAAFPRLVFEEAFKANLIHGNEVWKKIIEARNLSTHTYDIDLAKKLVERIKEEYLEVFQKSFLKVKSATKV